MAAKTGRKQNQQRKISEFSTPPVRIGEMAASGTPSQQQPSGSGTETVSNAEVMAEIRRMHAELVGMIDPLIAKQTLAQAHSETLTTKLNEAEGRIAALEAQLKPLILDNRNMALKLKELESKVDDQESRGRRNNVRVTGLPEGTEPGAVAPYCETLFRELFPEALFSSSYVVERAHRVLRKKPPPGAPPRALIVRFLNFRDRDTILTAAREAGEVKLGAANLQFYPDFTQSIQKARRDFWDTKQILRQKKIVYAMLFPAKLRVLQNGRSLFFTCPKAAKQFAMELPISPQARGSPRNNNNEAHEMGERGENEDDTRRNGIGNENG